MGIIFIRRSAGAEDPCGRKKEAFGIVRRSIYRASEYLQGIAVEELVVGQGDVQESGMVAE